MPEILEVSQMLSNAFEPKRKFRWYLAIDGIDAFTLKTTARPHMQFEETVIDWINVKRFISGKGTPQPIPMTLHDPIAPSAAQKVIEWMRLNLDLQSGRSGYSLFYKKDISLKLLDPQGTVVELIDLQGTWPTEINLGDLDYASSDNVEISCQLRYDSFVVNF